MAYLGIDFGGSKVAFRLNGARRHDSTLRWRRSADLATDLAMVADHLRTLRVCCGEPIEAVGMAVPATLDRAGRVTAWPNRPSWIGLDLPGFVASELPGAAVRWGDDGDLAALAEAHHSGRADLTYLGVGTGVGGGLVLGGRLRDGAEIGHVVIDRGGPRCACGRRGCLQALACGPATLRRAATARAAPVSVADLRAGYANRQPWAVRALTETAEALAVAVVGVGELLRPPLVRIGGGFAHALPELVPMVAAAASAWARPGHPAPSVEPAALGEESSLYGALELARGTSRPAWPNT